MRIVIDNATAIMIKRHALKQYAIEQGLDPMKAYSVKNLELHLAVPKMEGRCCSDIVFAQGDKRA